MEVMCAVCEEMVPVSSADLHSTTCVEDPDKKPITMPVPCSYEKLNQSEMEHEDLDAAAREFDQKIFKQIQAFQKKLLQVPKTDQLDSQFSQRLLEERALIHEVIRHSNTCMLGESGEIQMAIDALEELEDENDLNQKLSFNNHLLYFRVV